jgi:hypothetical protein
MRRGLTTVAGVAVLALSAPAHAATPDSGTLDPKKTEVKWEGSASPGLESGLGFAGSFCFGGDGKPDPTSGCDFLALTVDLTEDSFRLSPGALDLRVTDFGSNDLDMWVYKRKDDGTVGDFVGGDGDVAGEPEDFVLDKPHGSYWVVITNYTAPPGQTYKGAARLVLRPKGSITALNRKAHPGFVNYRASHDRFTSHSEPTVALDPLDPNHLMAGSKMYENNAKYLFKAGTYESFDGGRSWLDQGQLPGYCTAPGECDPADEAGYRVVSDPTIAWDDEGGAYMNVLDALGGTANFRGFNMTAHLKKPGKPWSEPIVVHDNRADPVSEQLLLDDKNWIAVDNATDVDGGANKPRDGKVGTVYICWSLDGTSDPTDTVPFPVQQIVLMKSIDGGLTWGGYAQGDNTPKQLSAKGAISGIGCHIAIGPAGEVFVTWYDNQAQALMQVVSFDRGETFTPPAPIAFIVGVDEPFRGQTFRNLSIPSTAIDSKGTLYVVVTSRNAEGSPVTEGARELGRQLKNGEVDIEELRAKYLGESEPDGGVESEHMAKGDGEGPESGSDVVMFKSTDGGNSYTGPIRVNQDPPAADADQFQPWIAVTKKGQVNVSFFDRRNDPQNFFIDTYLARSNDGGGSFFDLRVSQSLWDPSVGTPTSVSGAFIGDYQGLAADDAFAYPFWNDTQLNNLPKKSKRHSPWQEVFSARVPNGPASFIQAPRFGKGLGLAPPRIPTLPARPPRSRAQRKLLERRAARRRAQALRKRRRIPYVFQGRALDAGAGQPVTRVTVSVVRRSGKRCKSYAPRKLRFVRRACSRPIWFKARGGARWRASVSLVALRRGRYTLSSRAFTKTSRERAREPGRNVVKFRLR